MHDYMEEMKQPKVRLLKVLLTFCLSAAIIMGTMPCEPFVVKANADPQEPKTITGLTTGTIMAQPLVPERSEDPWQGSYVYYGKYKDTPMKYRVLSAIDSNLLLDCDNVLSPLEYSTYSNSNEYASRYCWVRQCLNNSDFFDYPRVFTDAERGVIKDYYDCDPENEKIFASPAPSGFQSVGVPSGDHIFILDVIQAVCNSYGYGYFESAGVDMGSKARIKKTFDGAIKSYWLRSPSDDVSGNNLKYACAVDADGKITSYSVRDSSPYMSPAFVVDRQSVIFSSLIGGEGGQPDSEYKLTILDKGLSVSANECTVDDDHKITIPYTVSDNSSSAEPTQISAVVTKNCIWNNVWQTEGENNASAYLQYTKLDVDGFNPSGSGTGSFTLDPSVVGAWGEDCHIYILAEDVNGTYETDYASAPVEIRVVSQPKALQAGANDQVITYDGKPHGICVNYVEDEDGNAVEDADVKYGLSSDSCTSDTSPTITSAADSPKVIYYEASKEGYLSAKGSATVSINKARLVVSALNAEIQYGEAPKNEGVEYTGFVNGENESVLGGTLEFEYDYTQNDKPGAYHITPKGLKSDNYDFQYKTAFLFVTKAQLPNRTVSQNTKYGQAGTIDLKEYIVNGGALGSGLYVSDPEGILDGNASISGNVISYQLKDDPGNVGKEAWFGVSVSCGDNYIPYNITVTLTVTGTVCEHLHTELRGKKEAGCTEPGYTGDLYCKDCGNLIEKGEVIPVDPDNHNFEKVEVVKKATTLTKGETKYRCSRCHTEKIVADIPCVEEEEKNFDELRNDLEGLSGNAAPVVENGKDEKGNDTETVKIGGEEVSKTITDPESGKETIVSKVWIAGLEKTYTYTGAAIKPAVRVYDGTRKLIEKTDYTLSYKNNKEVGTNAEIIVKFKGSYASSESTT
ncbi:MAG: hypothetical protein K5770_13840, partial [Lachnospiraceae bacterium]|nr:hypothetical protein [Lachnospiraceae bacterium]